MLNSEIKRKLRNIKCELVKPAIRNVTCFMDHTPLKNKKKYLAFKIKLIGDANLDKVIKEYSQIIMMNRAYYKAYILRAEAYMRNNQLLLAEGDIKHYLTKHPSEIPARKMLVLCYFMQDKYSEALQALDFTINYISRDAFFIFKRAICNLRTGRYESALEDLAKVLKSHPDHIEAHYYEAQVYLCLRQYTKLERKCSLIIQQFYDYREIRYWLARSQYAQRKYRYAFENFRNAPHYNFNRSDLLYWQGKCYMQWEDDKKALVYFKNSLDVSITPGEFHRAHNKMAIIYFRSGNKNLALENIYLALDNNVNIKTLNTLMIILLLMNEYEFSSIVARRILSLDADHLLANIIKNIRNYLQHKGSFLEKKYYNEMVFNLIGNKVNQDEAHVLSQFCLSENKTHAPIAGKKLHDVLNKKPTKFFNVSQSRSLLNKMPSALYNFFHQGNLKNFSDIDIIAANTKHAT